MPKKKPEDPIVTAALEAAESALQRRTRGIFRDPRGALLAAVNSGAKAAAVKARQGMVSLEDVEAILRDRDQLLEPEEVDGLMRAMYGAAGVDPDDLPEHLRLPDDAG